MVAMEQLREERLVELAHQIDLLSLEFAQEAAAFAAAQGYGEDGYVSAIDWLRLNCHMTSTAASNAVCVGQNLSRLGDSREKLYDAQLGYAHMVVLARAADDVRDAFDERDLLRVALENSPGKLHYVCRDYRHAKHPVAVAREEAELIEQRSLRFGQWPNGAVSVSGVLDPVGGAAVITALEPLARLLGPDDKRTKDRRMADALVELASGGEVKASLQTTASVETLAGMAGASCADIQNALPISSAAVEQLACDCSITRVILDSKSMVIDVGRAKRLPSVAMRRALNARDKGCRWPNCDRPASWSATHHLKHWIRGGPTDLPNLVLLCHRHHTLVHRYGWQVVRADDGAILTVPPLTTFPRGPD